jgi:hypothetical protein
MSSTSPEGRYVIVISDVYHFEVLHFTLIKWGANHTAADKHAFGDITTHKTDLTTSGEIIICKVNFLFSILKPALPCYS